MNKCGFIYICTHTRAEIEPQAEVCIFIYVCIPYIYTSMYTCKGTGIDLREKVGTQRQTLQS